MDDEREDPAAGPRTACTFVIFAERCAVSVIVGKVTNFSISHPNYSRLLEVASLAWIVRQRQAEGAVRSGAGVNERRAAAVADKPEVRVVLLSPKLSQRGAAEFVDLMARVLKNHSATWGGHIWFCQSPGRRGAPNRAAPDRHRQPSRGACPRSLADRAEPGSQRQTACGTQHPAPCCTRGRVPAS